MKAVEIAVGCAVMALVAGSGLSRLSPAERDGLAGTARALLRGAMPASTAPSRADPERTTASPLPAPSLRDGEVIAADARGQFQTAVEIEGQILPVMIDTGATFLALSYEDADRLGIRPMPADFRLPMTTANGRTYAAPVRLSSVRLGGIVVRDVSAIVAGRGQMSQTLLGMSFLSRLSGVSVDHGQLVLRP